MNFELVFTAAGNIKIAPKVYDEELDDVRSILFDICEAIDGNAEFVVDAFGQTRWPVDVATDLSVFLEQLSEVINAVKAGEETTLDFYEQGTERRIDCTLAGSDYACRCFSRTDWEPSPDIEYIEQKLLLKKLVLFREKFAVITESVAPHLLSHPMLIAWLK
jgi:hypothetical protein